MAFVANLEDEDKKNEVPQQGAERVLSTSQSGNINAGEGSSAPAEARKTGSAGWSNLQSYITANKGNDADMANKVGEKVDTQATTIADTQSTLGTKANTDIAKSTVKDSGVVGALTSDPTQVDKNAFNAQRNATYKGPNDVTEYQEYAKQQADINKLKGTLENTQSQEGREVLLDDTYKRNDYNKGMKKLDSFILGAGTDSKQKIEGLNQKHAGVETNWNKFNDDIRGAISGAKQATQKTAEDTRKAYEQALGNTSKVVQNAKAATETNNTQRSQQFNQLATDLDSQDPAVRASAMQRAGVDPAVGEWLLARGVMPKDLISQTGKAAVGNFLSDKDRNNYAALMGLDDRQVNEDLATKGETDRVFNVDSQRAAKAAEARELQRQINEALPGKQAERKAAFERIQNKLKNKVYDDEVAAVTGLSKEDFDYAHKNDQIDYKTTALDLAPQLSAGRDLTLGDIANDAQRNRWSELRNAIGINDGFDINDVQDEGQAFNFDKGKLRQQVDAKRERFNKVVSNFLGGLKKMNENNRR